jgi:dihydropteroate synthase
MSSARVLPFGDDRQVPLVMGILNVTPDSFSDGGVHFDAGRAVQSALQMQADGAQILDIGGESTRPGSNVVPVEEELRRVLPVISGIRARSAIPISVDTRKAAVARAALDAGADLVNDVSAMTFDPEIRSVVAERDVPVILMHMRGEPATMQSLAHYEDVVADVRRELAARREEALLAGVRPERILVDPGIGFAKTAEHNLTLLARCDELRPLGPIVVGASRKRFIGDLTGQPSGVARASGSLAAVQAAYRAGAAVIRVHDVRQTVDFLKVLAAIEAHRR